MSNMLLALAYDDINQSKAIRLRDCATWLEYRLENDGKKRLVSGNFCKVRLCPMCSWRRGLKIFAHTKSILDGMASEKPFRYIFLTLTVKNVSGSELDPILDDMTKAWDRFSRSKAFKQAVKGYYRGLEVTHNLDLGSKDYDTFHPHFHCVLAVNPSYFSSAVYINHAEWTALWRSAMRLDYDPIVNIKRVAGTTAEAVSEVAKYAVKSSDYIIPDDWDLTVDTVRILDKALERRRLVAYGGLMKTWHKKLNLDDDVDGDLVHLSGEEPAPLSGERIYYSWNVGYNQYIKAL